MTSRLTMFWLAGLVVIALAGAWGHSWMLRSRTATLTAIKQDAASLRQKIAEAPAPDSVREFLRAQYEELNVAVPLGDDLTDVLGPLAADLTDLTEADRSLVTGAIESTDALNRIPMLLTFRSSFPAAFELLSRVSEYSRILRVRQLVMTRPFESSGETIEVSARIVTFARTTEEGR